MYKVDNAIFKRKSTRRFTKKTIEKDKLKLILSAAMVAPSARNQQEWEFIIIDDDSIKKRLSTISPFAKPIEESDICVALVANTLSLTRDAFIQQDMSCAAQNMLLMATELGIGSVWIGVCPNEDRMDKLNDILELPDYILPFCIIALGYPYDEMQAREKYDENKISYNKYGERYK